MLFFQIIAQYTYSQLESAAVDIIKDTVSLNMKTSGPEEQRSFSFDTEKEGDIANLISSYSPVHSNWKRVGEAKTRLVSQPWTSTHIICSLPVPPSCFLVFQNKFSHF